MRIPIIKSSQRGSSTFVDMLFLVLTAAILVGWFIPEFILKPRRRTGCGISCVSNLKQVGLACRIWSNDNGDRFPWMISTNANGTLELTNSGNAFCHFLALSNEMSSPKAFYCPQDRLKARAVTWMNFDDGALSYFVGWNASEDDQNSLLSGDRTISTNGRIHSGSLILEKESPVQWAKGLHPEGGNIGLADGSVHQVTSRSRTLKRMVGTPSNEVILLLPSTTAR